MLWTDQLNVWVVNDLGESMVKNTLEQWLNIFNNKHNFKYDYSKIDKNFIGTDIIEPICPEHGSFKIKAANHRRGNGCKKCSGFKRYSIEDYIKECSITHSNKYNYEKVIDTRKEKIEIICPDHGSFFQNFYSHKNGVGCPKCGQNKNIRKNINDFLQIFNEKHNFKYDYSKSVYKGSWEKIEIICPEHGSFFQAVSNHKTGSGCPKCSEEYFKLNPRGKKPQSEIIKNFLKTHSNKYDYSKVEYEHNKEKIEIICPDHGSFFQTPNSHQSGSGCPTCTINGTSKPEFEIDELFNNIFIRNSRNIIKPKEIDLFNETYKFGIEYNGIMFHSFGLSKNNIFDNYHKLDKNKHLNKTLAMEEQGYQLFHIKDIDWNDPIKKEIWKSIINNKLNNSVRFFARKLKIIDLTNQKPFVKDFLNNNHLQGSCGYKYAYGLCNEKNEVYSIMTFGKSRFNRNIEYELIRFCNLKNTNIVGGASKLLKYFEKTIKPKSLISYANRDWSQGNLYLKLGFEFIEQTSPNYIYLNKNGILVSRISAQKHKLKNLLMNEYNEDLSERDNMIQAGYRIYYDTGNLKFIKKYK